MISNSPFSKDARKHKFTKSREEEKSPVEAKDVDQLHPGVVLAFNVSHKLALDRWAELLALGEGIRGAEVGQGVVGACAGGQAGWCAAGFHT